MLGAEVASLAQSRWTWMIVRRFAPFVVLAMVCLALGASAQNAPAVSTVLTPEEREFALKQYETTRR